MNLKLDKTKGLTEALAARAMVLQLGFGCMVGSSLAMVPATLLPQDSSDTDLDAPRLLSEDRSCPIQTSGAGIHPPTTELWG